MTKIGELLATFERERDRFARWDPRVSATTIEFTDANECTLPTKCAFRDLAYAEPGRMVITFHPRVLGFPIENQVGLMRHELGHLVDTMPYVVNTGREQAADDIAERVTGQKVRYDHNLVQTISEDGIWPRPLSIHW